MARIIFLLPLQPFFESDLCTYEPHESESKSYSTRLLYIEEEKQQKSIKYYENSSCTATEIENKDVLKFVTQTLRQSLPLSFFRSLQPSLGPALEHRGARKSNCLPGDSERETERQKEKDFT